MKLALPKLPSSKMSSKNLTTIVIAILVSLSAYTFYQTVILKQTVSKLSTQLNSIQKSQDNFSQNFSEDLFNDHLSVSNQEALIQSSSSLEVELTLLKTSSTAAKVSEIYRMYGDFQTKLKRNSDVKIDTSAASSSVGIWQQQLLAGNLDEITTSLNDQITQLDASYKKYTDSLPKPETTAISGYSYVTVNTEKGKFGVSLFKFAMSDVKVKTISANTDNCKNNCPTKSLETYVKNAGGFAGINGTYFCPPDYSSCSGKVNSYDYAFYNSSEGKWLNKSALSWFKTGLFTFNGSSVKFYKKSSDYGGGGVTGGISNYPSLLEDGNYVVKLSDLTTYQKDSKGPKGFIGVGGSNIYFGIVYNATVPEAAYAVRALGVKDALNIDGGGSSAMYINGKYVVGPGRSLPNAIVITK